ncbi:hypothetical protein BpHYR1_031128, partial [Brachionus plicatilis]
ISPVFISWDILNQNTECLSYINFFTSYFDINLAIWLCHALVLCFTLIGQNLKMNLRTNDIQKLESILFSVLKLTILQIKLSVNFKNSLFLRFRLNSVSNVVVTITNTLTSGQFFEILNAKEDFWLSKDFSPGKVEEKKELRNGIVEEESRKGNVQNV